MTRHARFALAFAFVLPLAACADDGNADTTSTTNADEIGTEADTTADTTADTADEPGDTTGGDDSFCLHVCSSDADCMVDGQDVGFTCQDSFCTAESAGCTDDPQCVAQFSGWMTPCTSGGGECEATAQLCIQGPDGGLCATPPSDFFMCDQVPGWSEFEVPDIDGNPVTVCGNANAECNDDGYCFSPCLADADCASAAYPICNTDTGICACGDDSHCATIGEPHLSVCNDGLCGCGEDQQCIGDNAGDVCTSSGVCGCTSDAVCANTPNTFDGGMISCVMP